LNLPGLSERNIALTGFMAVGKSAVGQRLSRRLGMKFVDLDRAVEKKEGMKVGAIFEQKGEDYFRSVEKQVLKEVLRRDGQVIATGGGVVMDEENLSLLKERSFLVWLTAPVRILLRRAGAAKGRPLLEGQDRRKRVEELLERRQPRYARADVSIDTGFLSVDEVVEEIIKSVKIEKGKLQNG
jgi:shikimate kinase